MVRAMNTPDSPAGRIGTDTADDSEAHYTNFGDQRVPASAKAGQVERVFTSVARRYDLMNDLLSGGLHRLWKDAMVAWLAPAGQRHAYRHLDVAGGTGDIAIRVLQAGGPAATSLVVDINPAMMTAGLRRPAILEFANRLAFAAGDAENLPLPDRSVDACTIAFGIRNVTRIDRALGEMHRVLRHGGRFMCLEFSQVSVPVLDDLYETYSDRVIPILGQVVGGDRAAYRYLVESIRRFPPQREFAGMVESAGFSRVAWRDLTGGIAAIHSGWRL